MSISAPFRAYVTAMERVEQRLRKVTAALDAAGVPYAVVGGNAVAVWVAKADPGATRTTKDVDLLVNRADVGRVTEVMTGLGFLREDLRSSTLFVDPSEPNRKTGVQLVWAGERVRPSYDVPAPTTDEVVREPEGFRALTLSALVRMKLTSLRNIDRVHLEDLLRVGLVDEAVRASLPTELRKRLDEVEHALDDAEEL